MFQNWRERNIKYYEKNFKLLEKGQRAQFNWASFFFGPAWFAYRKMYMWAFIFQLISFCSVLILDQLRIEIDGLEFKLIDVCVSLGLWIVVGNFANHMYYKNVQHKIKSGYNELEKYCSTSFVLGLAVFIFYGLSDIDNFTGSIGLIITLLFAVTDYAVNRFHSVDREKEPDVSAQNIHKYLRKNGSNHFWGRVLTVITCFIAIIGILCIRVKVSTVSTSVIDSKKPISIIELNKEIDEKVYKAFKSTGDPGIQKAVQNHRENMHKMVEKINDKINKTENIN